MEFKAEIKKTFTGPDKLRAVCSVILNDCFLVKNVRVVEGEKGLFVSLPSRRNVKGEWTEQCFPMTKELREKLSALLAAFADAGANILTVNQNIPAGGVASVSISARTDRLAMPVDGFVRTLGALPGVERITRLTGEGITGLRLDMPGA